MNKKKWITVVLGLIISTSLFAQANLSLMEEIYDREQLTIEQAAYIIYGMKGEPTSNLAHAYQKLTKDSFYKNKLVAKKGYDAITRGDFSLMVMREFDMKGGLNYTLFKNRRYASRSIVALGYMNEGGIGEGITPFEAVSVITNIMKESE